MTSEDGGRDEGEGEAKRNNLTKEKRSETMQRTGSGTKIDYVYRSQTSDGWEYRESVVAVAGSASSVYSRPRTAGLQLHSAM